MPMSLGHHTETRSHNKRTSLKRLGILAGFSLLLILMAANALMLRRELKVQIDNQGKVTHTEQVLSELKKTESLLEVAETGQRGFLYTGDPKYLEPYNLAIAQVEPHLDALDQLTADKPIQRARLFALRVLALEKLDELGQTVSLYSSNRADEAKAIVLSDAGLIGMNNIRTLTAQMELEENSLKASQTTETQRSIHITIAGIYLACLFGILSVILLAYYIFLELNRRERHLHELWRREEWYRVTLNSIGDAVICTDSGANVIFLNAVAERLTGWPLKEANGRPMDEVFQIVDPITRKQFANPMVEAVALNRTMHLPLNCILIRRDGHGAFIEDSAAPIHNYEGKITGSVIVFRDVSTERALAEEVVHASQHDPLTGLPNRVLLNDRLGQAIALASRHAGQVAVLFLDLDGFKNINDSLGHLTGDKLLQSISARLQECVRAPDTVSRQGGDEFIVLLQDVQQAEDAAITAKRVLEAISVSHTIDIHKLHVTASIGVSLYPGDGSNAETLIKNADTAMYQAKENGRQCFKFFKPAMNAQAVERQSLEADMRLALKRHEFTLHYQPKVDLRTGAIIGAEALLRWTHPRRGAISPAKFIPVAEDSGLILPIGAWVLREACTQAKTWADAGLPSITVAVNVSAIQLGEDNFLEGLTQILSESGLEPGILELEVTESVLMKHAKLAASILQSLRDKGVQVSVDDFGTGYSSLSYLREFPLDALKIDQSFIRRVEDTPEDSTIVTAIVSMAHSLNLRVIAEGVETAGSLQFLKTLDCDEAQGNYFSRPVSADEFAKLLSADAAATLCS